ncbi:MAG: phage integrase N-terminal SAM-like domain-containing protein [Actinobacteria bacterium]|nr:phage integrase N-terminal SAM-like domain-containing protein [Actinomycetota bacterium]
MALQEDNWRTYVASSGSDGIRTAHGQNYVLTGWEWHLRAADRSPKTVHSYVQIVRRFLVATDVDPLTCTKADVGTYLLDLRADCQPSTVGLAYQVLAGWSLKATARTTRWNDSPDPPSHLRLCQF